MTDRPRASGKTNMYGARPYLASEFEMEDKPSRDVLSAWIKTFDGTTSLDDRAAAYLDTVAD